jgi:hypothetical protein
MIDWNALQTQVARDEAVLQQARYEATAELLVWLDETAAAVTGKVPIVERLSWASKEAAARVFLRDGGPVPALIAVEAAALGVTPLSLAARIIAKADAYIVVAARLAAARQSAMKGIADALSPDGVWDALGETLAVTRQAIFGGST